ncbi:hypothetical protein [Salegentibacter chungangensis]|uniref:Uncharacterized protein n=1 Tax=Salegentibacter chungangensis TaxID=1335724 RepID=A0ABW3NPS5_9FLAO
MKLIHQSPYFTSYQCDRQRSFFIDFKHKSVKMSLCQLLAFRQQINSIDLDSHFDGRNKHGFELVMLCNNAHLFIFNTYEVIALKDFIKVTFAMLELNSMAALNS